MLRDALLDLGRVLVVIGGLVATFVGWAMWQEPHLDWDTLTLCVIDEANRLISDPFGILGLVIMLLGIGVVIRALSSTGPSLPTV